MGALSSLGGAGGASASSSASSEGQSQTGGINVGGLNTPATPNQTALFVVGGVVLAGIVVFAISQRPGRR